MSYGIVQVHCQTEDIAGNKIPDEERCEEEWNFDSANHTDARGLATFNLGDGTYIIEAGPGSPNKISITDYVLESGADIREIIEIDS